MLVKGLNLMYSITRTGAVWVRRVWNHCNTIKEEVVTWVDGKRVEGTEAHLYY